MTTLDQGAALASAPRPTRGVGPVTAARLRRTSLVYAAMLLVGIAPSLLHLAPFWRAAGLGLWAPGAGFLSVGGWAGLMFGVTLILFVVSLIAWFWAGMVLAPITVWLGSALLAGAMAGGGAWTGAPAVTALFLAGVAGVSWNGARKRRVANLAKAEARAAFIPQSLAEVRVKAAQAPDPAAREMSADDLGAVRYLLDRALQPIERFDGFDIIDQFQPAALRYQLNHMGFALGVAQTAYTPSFSGYLGQAQRNLIEKYLLRKVWGYWVWESCWGHLNFTNHDPAARDNIMLTGWFGMHVGQYMLATGDRRYAEPGALSFRLDARKTFAHDFHSLIGSVVSNYTRDEGQFCLYPCEPNWIYPICNHYGMTSLASHDRLYGTDYVARFLPSWLAKLDSEFTDESGTIIGLRSQLTGLEAPFPTGEAGYANFANWFAPERARRLWAVARREIAPAVTQAPDGRARVSLPGRGIDAGNYSAGHTASFSSIMSAAREFGDDELALAAQHSLDLDCGLSVEGGARRYLGGSNLANANAVMGRLMRTGDFRRSFVEGPPACALTGPILEGADYPAVLVARAYSDGEGLDLTLHPGAGPGPHRLTLGRLRPGADYALTGALAPRLVAGRDGTAAIEVELAGRTVVTVRPER